MHIAYGFVPVAICWEPVKPVVEFQTALVNTWLYFNKFLFGDWVKSLHHNNEFVLASSINRPLHVGLAARGVWVVVYEIGW